MASGYPEAGNGQYVKSNHPEKTWSSRAGVLVDPTPSSLPAYGPVFNTGVSEDLMEQHRSQEQSKLLQRYRLLQQWQQQQQAQLMQQQQQQLAMLKSHQDMVQQALAQQRQKQWGGIAVTKSPPKSPSRTHSPSKSPASSPSRGTKASSSLPRALAQASAALSMSQRVAPQVLETLLTNANQYQQEPFQDTTDFDSGSDHPGSVSVDGVYPLSDTASEASDTEVRANGTLTEEEAAFDSNIQDEDHIDQNESAANRSTSLDFSPHPTRHLSIHLPNDHMSHDQIPPLPPDLSSPVNTPSLSPSSPISPTHPRQEDASLDDTVGTEEADERPIALAVGGGVKSFEELIEMNLKLEDAKTPSSSSPPSDQPTNSTCRPFLRKGEGIARFGMKPRKLKPWKPQSTIPGQPAANDNNKKARTATGRTGKNDNKSGQSVNKKKAKKEEPPKISRKVSSKAKQQATTESSSANSGNVFKKPLPVSQLIQRDNAFARSPIEKEKVAVGLQPQRLQDDVPDHQHSEDKTSGHDDTLEVSYQRRLKVLEKHAEIEKEDLDEFEMLEQAADDNISFSSEASLVVNVMQRAQRRQQNLLGMSPSVRQSRLPILESVDGEEQMRDSKSHEQSHDESDDSTEEQENDSNRHSGHESVEAQRIFKETLGDARMNGLSVVDGHARTVSDAFYSSDDDSDHDEWVKNNVVNVERKLVRHVSRTNSERAVKLDYDNTKLDKYGDNQEEEDGSEDHDHDHDHDHDEVGGRRTVSSTIKERRTKLGVKVVSNKEQKGDNRIHDVDVDDDDDVKKEMDKDDDISDEDEDDYKGTPRKQQVASTSSHAVNMDFEDEETWGEFSAHLTDSSDEESIVAMAPTSTMMPSTAGGDSQFDRKTVTGKTTDAEGPLSPPPTSALIAKLFPKLRQPEEKQKKEMEKQKLQQEKTLQTLADRPTDEGSQARLLRDKLTQLENEIERFRRENTLLAKLREEREKGLDSLKKEISEFQIQKADELKRLQEFKDEETKKLKREKKLFEKHQKTLRAMPDKRDREEIEMLKMQLTDLQDELKQRESRWNASTRRLKDRIQALETENSELREEVKLLEQRRLSAWKKGEEEKANTNTYSHPSIIPKRKAPDKPVTKTNIYSHPAIIPKRKAPDTPVTKNNFEQRNNNNKNLKKVETEDEPVAQEGERRHHTNGKTRTFSDSSDENYVQASPLMTGEESTHEETNIYESRLPIPRRNRSPSDEKRAPVPVPAERRSPPLPRTKPPSLSAASPSLTQSNPSPNSPYNPPNQRISSSPHRTSQTRVDRNSPDRGGMRQHQTGGTGEWEEILHPDGKVEQIKKDGSRTLTFLNGTKKEISADGRSIIISFFNGDMKQILPDQRVMYYYSETKTTHTTYPDGLEILQFSNNQTEKHYPDGTKEITFPDQTIKYLFPNGGEESVFVDGTVLRVEPNGQRTMEFPNGQREIHTDQYKRREYPDGTIKTVYPDGRQETRYSSGRLRIKDKDGTILVDKKC